MVSLQLVLILVSNTPIIIITYVTTRVLEITKSQDRIKQVHQNHTGNYI